jgi:hypothetical protein
MLYRCKKEEPQFNELSFLIAAAGKDKGSSQIYNRILVEREKSALRLSATDSRSLHIVKLELLEGITLEPGDYEIIKSNTSEIILWEKEFEEPFVESRDLLFTKGTRVLPSLEILRPYDSEAIFQICNAGFRMEFDRLNLLKPYKWKVSTDKEKKMLLFTSGNLQALIMCLPEPSNEKEDDSE